MVRLVGIVISIGLADSLNPTTIAPALYLATGERARGRVAEFTAGVFAVYFLGGAEGAAEAVADDQGLRRRGIERQLFQERRAVAGARGRGAQARGSEEELQGRSTIENTDAHARCRTRVPRGNDLGLQRGKITQLSRALPRRRRAASCAKMTSFLWGLIPALVGEKSMTA